MEYMGKWNYKRKIKAGAGAFLLSTGILCFSAFAEGPSSNVWLDVVKAPTEMRISVTVPLCYGFAVLGSVESGDTGAVSVEDGNLILSNVKVVVSEPSGPLPGAPGDSTFSIETIADSAVPIRNYSTDAGEESAEGEEPKREGLPVSLSPYMLAVPEVRLPGIGVVRHHWKPSVTEPEAIEADFKKFRMELDGYPFSLEDTTITTKGDILDIIRLDGLIELAAPPDVLTNGYTVAGTAHIPSNTYLSVNVKVGGIQNQYKQVEESLKVGEIVWEIIPGVLPEPAP